MHVTHVRPRSKFCAKWSIKCQKKLSQLSEFVGGFDLAGWRRNGRIYCLGEGQSLDQWPEEIAFGGNVYTLESVEECNSDDALGVWENAIYV